MMSTSSLGDEDRFLRPLESTVERILSNQKMDIQSLPPQERQAVGVATNLQEKLAAFRRNNNCPRCWLQRAHCICDKCPPLPLDSLKSRLGINRVFVLMHHKEICLHVDTAKLILAAFPDNCRLVVAGLGPDVQESMGEMLEAMQQKNCLVLFPSQDSKTIAELEQTGQFQKTNDSRSTNFDLVIIDGTWEQARRMHKKLPIEPQRVQLSDEALEGLKLTGRQLRRHPEEWREISTLAAMRFLLQDIDMDPIGSWDVLADYQTLADAAARAQLGAPRSRGEVHRE
jgi:DTW domain-containing protein YfiP